MQIQTTHRPKVGTLALAIGVLVAFGNVHASPKSSTFDTGVGTGARMTPPLRLNPRYREIAVPTEAPRFSERLDTALDFGHVWCLPVWDEENLIISTESNGEIFAAPFDLNHRQLDTAIKIAGREDSIEREGIADHKHIFQDDHHYITFSISGGGQGGSLYLLRLNRDLERIRLVNVVQDAPPTNDMFMTGDGETVSVGKFLPGFGHEMYVFDADLNFLGSQSIGGGPERHANGAAALYHDSLYHVVAPRTLAPGKNDWVYHMAYDSEWRITGPQDVLLHDPGMITLITGLSREPNSDTFLVHYARTPDDGGGPVYRSVFDRYWNELETVNAIDGSFMRPHSIVVDDLLFVGYEGGNFSLRLASFDIRN